jgi:hypothetical protein
MTRRGYCCAMARVVVATSHVDRRSLVDHITPGDESPIPRERFRRLLCRGA